jgi:hypothetical protein
MLRRSDLCPTPAECPYVLMENPFATADSERCEDCPLSALEDYLESAAASSIAATITLDFALRAGVTVTLAEISYPEFLRLRLLAEERDRYQEELMRKPR